MESRGRDHVMTEEQQPTEEEEAQQSEEDERVNPEQHESSPQGSPISDPGQEEAHNAR